jgi:O-methyltransferase
MVRPSHSSRRSGQLRAKRLVTGPMPTRRPAASLICRERWAPSGQCHRLVRASVRVFGRHRLQYPVDVANRRPGGSFVALLLPPKGDPQRFLPAKNHGGDRRKSFRELPVYVSRRVDVFSESEDGRFGLTPLAACLQTGVSGSLRAFAIFHGEELYRAWGEVVHSVKTGATAFKHVLGMEFFPYFAQHPAAGANFEETMTNYTTQVATALAAAYDFSRFGTLIDIGRVTMISKSILASPTSVAAASKRYSL